MYLCRALLDRRRGCGRSDSAGRLTFGDRGSPRGRDMKTKRKIWLGVGAFVVAGAGATGAAPLIGGKVPDLGDPTGLIAETAVPRTAGVVLAQHVDHPPKAGEAGEEGGEKGVTSLP